MPASGGDRRQALAGRRARRPAAARHRARRRRAPSRHPSGQVSPAACLPTRTRCTTAKPITITTSTTAWTARSTNAVARGAPWTWTRAAGQGGGTAHQHPGHPAAADREQVHGQDHRHAQQDHGQHQRGQGVGGGGVVVVEQHLEQLLGRHQRHAQEQHGGNRQQHEHHGQLAQRVAALAPADGRLGQQVPAEDDGAEHDRLARHRHRGVRTAVRPGCPDRPPGRRRSAAPPPWRATPRRPPGRGRPCAAPTARRPSTGSGRRAAAQPPAGRTRGALPARPRPHRDVAGVGRRHDLAHQDADRGTGGTEAGRRPARAPRPRARPISTTRLTASGR